VTKYSWTVSGILLAAVFTGCRVGQTDEEVPVRPVVTITVRRPAKIERRSFSGAARAPIRTVLSFRVPGEIAELPAKIGMRIHVGDVVAGLDATDYELEAGRLEAQLSQAEAQLAQVSSEYERVRLLYEAGSASRSDLENARAAYETAQARKKALEEGLHLARQQSSYCVLRSPVDGRITAVEVEPHQTVHAGQAVAAVAAEGGMEFEAGLPERLISRVKTGQHAQVQFDVMPERTFSAHISQVGVAPNDSGVYPVRLILEESDPRVRPGMLGEVVLEFKVLHPARVVIPPVAVAKDPLGGNFVWVVDTNTMSVARRDVKIGELLSDGLEILDGLQPGDRIVIRGVHHLAEGMKIRLLREDERIFGVSR